MATALYHHEHTVRFGECDPAGVVYYPVFFNWFHVAMEAWFADAVGIPYEAVLQQVGFPAVHTEADFQRPCRIGDRLWTRVHLEKLGSRSLTLAFEILVAETGEVRARGRTTCVCIRAAEDGFSFSSAQIPTQIRDRLQAIADETPSEPAEGQSEPG